MPNQVSNSVRLILKPFLFDYKNKWHHFRLATPLFQVCHARFSVFMTARIMNSIGCFGKSIQTIFHGKGWLCNATEWRCTATLGRYSGKGSARLCKAACQTFHAMCGNRVATHRPQEPKQRKPPPPFTRFIVMDS